MEVSTSGKERGRMLTASMARPAPPSIPPGTLISSRASGTSRGGSYALGAKLGAGRMGMVFEATDVLALLRSAQDHAQRL